MAVTENNSANDPGFIAWVNQVAKDLNSTTRDTGWRDVSSLLLNGFTVGTLLRIRRKDDRVQLMFRGLNGSAATSTQFLAVPTGFQPVTDLEDGPFRSSADAYTEKLFVGTSAGFRMNVTGRAMAGSAAQIFEYPCSATWPATLPGTEV